MRDALLVALLAAACGAPSEPGGLGDARGCGIDLTCPVPRSDADVSVCGYVNDVTMGATIQDDGFTFRFFDAVSYIGDPAGTSPLPLEGPTIDECGIWVAPGVRRPASGELLIAVDAPGRRTTMSVFGAPSYGIFENVPVWSLLAFADKTWSQQLGMLGDTLVDRGAVLTFGPPGRSITVDGVANVYYFADTGLIDRSRLDPAATSIGENSAALLSPVDGVVNVSGSPYTGVPMQSVPGALLVTTLRF